MRVHVINSYLLGALFLLLAACNGDTPAIDDGNFNMFSAVLTGEVTAHNSGEPVEGAKVYLNERGPDCQKTNSFLAEPNRFDSTTTNAKGEFIIKFSLATIEQLVCIESFAVLKEGTEETNSDTVQFTTPLKREQPFDTTRVNLRLGS